MLSLLFALTVFASEPACLDGYYDFGYEAAALGFSCGEEGAQIVFCKRNVLLEKGLCTGQRSPIHCRWGEDAWQCEETGYYHFVAVIRKISEMSLSYRFKSRFNEGELVGERIRLKR